MMRIIERRKRKRKQAIPSNFMMYLNTAQLKTYIHMQKFGWQMYFIRRPLLRKHTIAMINIAGTRIGVIKHSGFFALNPMTINLRSLPGLGKN